jgi:heat shock protein HtpX
VLLRVLGARCTDEDELPRVHNLAEGLCASMGLPLPSIWVVEDETVNALALGRGPRTACLVVTSSLDGALDPVALEGLLAHELTHVKRCEIAPATVSAVALLPLALVAPGAGGAVHRLVGRGREFRADQLAVGVTRYPPGLREALVRIVDGARPVARASAGGRAAARSTRWLWTVAPPRDGGRDAPGDHEDGELDAASVRISALDER